MNDEWIEEVVALPGLDVVLRRPPSAEALIDEVEFVERDEFIPYWAEPWPSSLNLSRALTGRALRGARTLEIGCGLGLCGIVAALHGGRVTVSDWAAEAVDAAVANGALNDVTLTGLTADWRDVATLVDAGPWDLVLAADVVYEERNVEPLLALLPALCGERTEILFADPGRAHAATLLDQLPLTAAPLRDGVVRLAR